jgi:hypothetical protein
MGSVDTIDHSAFFLFIYLKQYLGHWNLPPSSDRPISSPYVLLLERTQDGI